MKTVQTTAEEDSSSDWGQQFPKVELHLHLEGSVRYQTVLREYSKQRLQMPSEDNTEELRNFFLMEKPGGSLRMFLTKLERTQAIFSSADIVEEIARDCVLDRYAKGVRVLEIRYSPAFMAHGHENMGWETIHNAIKKGIAQAHCTLGEDSIFVGLICIAVGSFGMETFGQTVDFAIQHRNDFVGFDIAGAEMDLTKYKDQMHRAYKAGFGITVHAAEDGETGDPQNAIVAVEQLHATRIGHGIQIIKDPNALKLIKEKQILLEICPYSNWVTGGVKDLQQHPANRLYRDESIRISINSDDPEFMNAPLTRNYQLLHDHFGFVSADFVKMNLWALEASFLPEVVKQKARKKFFFNHL